MERHTEGDSGLSKHKAAGKLRDLESELRIGLRCSATSVHWRAVELLNFGLHSPQLALQLLSSTVIGGCLRELNYLFRYF